MNLNATLLGQSITFVIFVLFCMKYIWPLIGAAMRERQEAIAAGLQASEEADKKLAQAASNVAGLVITGAEKVLQDNIDAAKHGEMLDKLAAEL